LRCVSGVPFPVLSFGLLSITIIHPFEFVRDNYRVGLGSQEVAIPWPATRRGQCCCSRQVPFRDRCTCFLSFVLQNARIPRLPWREQTGDFLRPSFWKFSTLGFLFLPSPIHTTSVLALTTSTLLSPRSCSSKETCRTSQSDTDNSPRTDRHASK